MKTETYNVDYDEAYEDDIIIASIRALPGFMITSESLSYIADDMFVSLSNYFEDRKLGLVEEIHLTMNERDPMMIASVTIEYDEEYVQFTQPNEPRQRTAEAKVARDLDRSLMAESITTTAEALATANSFQQRQT